MVSVLPVIPLGIFKVHLKLLPFFVDLLYPVGGFRVYGNRTYGWMEIVMEPKVCVEWTLPVETWEVGVGKFWLEQEIQPVILVRICKAPYILF